MIVKTSWSFVFPALLSYSSSRTTSPQLHDHCSVKLAELEGGEQKKGNPLLITGHKLHCTAGHTLGRCNILGVVYQWRIIVSYRQWVGYHLLFMAFLISKILSIHHIILWPFSLTAQLICQSLNIKISTCWNPFNLSIPNFRTPLCRGSCPGWWWAASPSPTRACTGVQCTVGKKGGVWGQSQ